MIPIQFSKSRAESILESINSGRAIDGPWTGNDLLMLTGACIFAAMSQGPNSFRIENLGTDWEDMPTEQQEFVEESFVAEIHGAAQFYSQLVGQVCDDEYDVEYEPNLLAGIQQDADEFKIIPVKGFKDVG